MNMTLALLVLLVVNFLTVVFFATFTSIPRDFRSILLYRTIPIVVALFTATAIGGVALGVLALENRLVILEDVTFLPGEIVPFVEQPLLHPLRTPAAP